MCTLGATPTHQSEARDPPEGRSRQEVTLEHAEEVLGSGDESLASDGGGDGAKVRELLDQLEQALGVPRAREMQEGGSAIGSDLAE